LRGLVVALAFAVGGCATTSGDPRDPFEGLNRGVYGFNDKVDTWVMRPVATGYNNYVPGEIRERVRNFFANIADPMIGVHNILQGKFEEGFFDWVRFGFNSTLGLFGLHDVATDMGYEKHNEDFGQTFGRWGSPPGPYLVLPFLGSSNIRDGIGLGLDYYFDPMTGVRDKDLSYPLWAVRVVQVRADLLDASRILEEAALDKYTFQRDAYLQRRRSLIYDGRPPREREPESRVNPREDRDVDNIAAGGRP
jgi:phospholipid-binding lipoprotein MlaA